MLKKNLELIGLAFRSRNKDFNKLNPYTLLTNNKFREKFKIQIFYGAHKIRKDWSNKHFF